MIQQWYTIKFYKWYPYSLQEGAKIMKRLFILFLAFWLSFLVSFFLYEEVRPEPDYCMWSSFSNTSQNYKEVSINILLLVDRKVDNNLYEEIKSFYNRMNGEPDKLIIYMYKTLDDILNGHEVNSKEFYK